MFSNNIVLILASLGIFQAAFLSVYLLTLKKGSRQSNIFLGLALLGLTIRIGKSVLNYYVPLDEWERNIGISGIFIAGPCLWLYGISLLEKHKVFTYRAYLHFLPWLIFVLFLKVIPSSGNFENYWNYGIVVFHLAIYLIISWYYLLQHRTHVSKSVFSWYRNILIGATLIWFYYLGNFLNYNLYYITGPIFYTLLVYALSYLFINRNYFSLDKYSSSTIDRNTSKALFQNIKTIFSNEHLYLDHSIALNTVAKKLDISPRIVSQVINENEQQNFYEFVNQYRIDKAKTLLADPNYSNEKIVAIAYDSGFGTATSFNVAFKRKTGMTPTAYRKQYLS